MVLVSGVARAQEQAAAPEAATGLTDKPVLQAREQMVVSAHPLATQAGYAMLEAGGSALDAAVAVQAMLTLVEPQSSGIGGGAFMLHWDAGQQRLQAFDGRETAPAAADPDLFLKTDGTPMAWGDALVGGRAVGVPGVLRMLELAHDEHGELPWEQLFQPAIRQSQEGFEVSPRLHRLIASGINPGLGRYPVAADYFFEQGEPLPVGTRLRNPALARTLEQIASEGADYFYRGPLAAQIVEAVQGASDNPGRLSQEDLAGYRAVAREPLCRPFFEHRVCSMPPPTSGGVTLLQILGLLAPFPLVDLEPDGAAFVHLFTQAARLAYADRARYLADSDFVPVPVDALLEPNYLARRHRLIDPERDMGEAAPGRVARLARGDDRSPEFPSTSHFVIVDAAGNAVSMTTSIEMAFGSTLMVGGFLLNNQLTDFAFTAEEDGAPVANRVQPGKRPRSSMTPVIVFDLQGKPSLLLGSPGGSRIINYVARTLLTTLVWDWPLQTAIAAPHVSNRNGYTALEEGRAAARLKPSLERLGHTVKVRVLNSGLHGIAIDRAGIMRSGIDPRREGAAMGQ
ncbi:gamma-glutamyltransferase [Motiliproteus sp. SC1-56]|uniref:gamma-glutamyltransferase n=1 Tax=Motiliproteus sp. SC1-56 TaxID=2799565 RepID=UPI001A8EFEED|nr:gamma-glutamyltransferase [Motiliproteus sp. SC1-56]